MLNLRELYGGRYKLSYDPAVAAYPELKSDTDYFEIPCRYGSIYPFSASILAFWCTSGKIVAQIKRGCPEVRIRNDGDGEAVFLFAPKDFDRVAKFAQPKRRKRLSEANRRKLAEAGRKSRFKAKQKEDL